MPESVLFEIVFSDAALAHLATIERRDHTLLFDMIEQQLAFEPMLRTRNRKPLRIPNAVNAAWELRCGMNNRYRVFYAVNPTDHLVVILALGRKQGNRLFIGKEEMEL